MFTDKATKQRNKAMVKKDGAIKSFTVAAEEVQAANVLLDESIALHKAEIESNADKIRSLLDVAKLLEFEIQEMESEQGRNEVLLGNLRQFVGY